MNRGQYIVIEGQDGTGKTTQIEMLAKHFRDGGREVVMYDESGGSEAFSTPRTRQLRKEVLSKTQVLSGAERVARYTEIRKILWNEFALPALRRNAVVVTARNWFSTLAYQGYGEGVDLDEIAKITRASMPNKYFKPDFIFVLLLDDDEREKRMNNRSADAKKADFFESQPQEFQDRVNHGYERIAQDFAVQIVDAAPRPGEIHAEIIAHSSV